MRKKRLGERLLESGLIQDRQLTQALRAQQSTGEQLGQLLVRLGYLDETDLLRLLCEDAGIPYTDLQQRRPEPAALAAVPAELARRHQLLPLEDREGELTVAVADPLDPSVVRTVEQAVGRRVSVVGAPRAPLLRAIDAAYRAGAPVTPAAPVAPTPALERAPERASAGVGSGPLIADLVETSSSASSLADEIFQKAIALGATDIHIEPTGDAVKVRYRLDGILRSGGSFPKSAQSPLLTRVKVLAGLNIAESRLPQDGRLRVRASGREIDLRISTFPTLHGEDLVLRVLDRGRVSLRLSSLGLPPGDLELFREVLDRPLGLVLITGPTGSGKTTTLYSALSEINNGDRCILTIEDPVEYELEGVRQSQVNARAGLTFAAGLRAMLRHDPDVVLVGEVRDPETAQIALSAAMTGHVVLSTLHTNSAAAAIPRLLDMGVEPFALATSLQLTVAQRLIRVLCARCREPADVPPVVRRRFELEDTLLYRARGCDACANTGYRGRVAVFEFLPVTRAVAEAIYERRTADEIQRTADRPTLLHDGLAKVRAGVTTLEELLRVVSL